MNCHKSAFLNEKIALEYIKKLKETSHRDRRPHRAYLCPDCMAWHLTSSTTQEERHVEKLEQKIKEQQLNIDQLLRFLNTSVNPQVQKYLKRFKK